MDLNQVKELLSNYSGNLSLIYPLISEDLEIYEDWEVPFKGEFLFFENYYLIALKYILENKMVERKVVDIGCQFGFQSIMFEGFEYHGIDMMNGRFFKKENLKNTFTVGSFPNIPDLDISDKIVISSMSLGYFEEDSIRTAQNTHLSEMQLETIDKLAEAKHLFVASTPLFVEELSRRFNTSICLSSKKTRAELYYFTNIIT